jgi:exodeoxyribonuclease III
VRIATWNVNSLKARLERVLGWLERAQPDVLLMQETKLADAAAPFDAFRDAGYELAHHGQGRWNGVAIASRAGAPMDVQKGFGVRAATPIGEEPSDAEPLAEARMIAARVGGVRVVSLYAPNGREVGTTFYEAKLDWYAHLSQWLEKDAKPDEALVLGGDLNVAPEDADVWDAAACHGGTHVSPRERDAVAKLCGWGLVDAYRLQHKEPDRYTWWDYRAGAFHKNYGMRIDHLLVTRPVAHRVVWTEIDREARKGKPIPSDHAPLVMDLDVTGRPFDAGWTSADARIAARRSR